MFLRGRNRRFPAFPTSSKSSEARSTRIQYLETPPTGQSRPELPGWIGEGAVPYPIPVLCNPHVYAPTCKARSAPTGYAITHLMHLSVRFPVPVTMHWLDPYVRLRFRNKARSAPEPPTACLDPLHVQFNLLPFHRKAS